VFHYCMVSLPNKCPNCGESKWITSGNSHFLPKATKQKEGGKFNIELRDGLFVRSFVCQKCSNMVFIKEMYDQDLR